MDPGSVLQWSATYGLGTVLSVLIAFAFWRTLVYVLRENAKREERLANILENHIQNLTNAVTISTQSLHQTTAQILEIKEANKLQREEHKEMIEVLKMMKHELSVLAVKG